MFTILNIQVVKFCSCKMIAIRLQSVKPGLHESQLQVERSVTFLYSLLVVERRC